jgi:photosystem II stability/assembly factor-like uncharacterized protein
MVWERLAALEGGTVVGLTTATTADGEPIVFAATPVGVFRSLDQGLSWHALGGASRVAGVEVVAASPCYAEDGIVFAGARDGLFRWRSGQGQPGWDHLLTNARVLGLAVPPGDGGHLTLLAGTEDDGVLISRDSGRTWTGANPGLLDLTILALAVSPDFARDALAFAATPSGLFRTRNGAESWRIVELDWDDVAVQCLAVSPEFADDRVVLAGTEDHGLLRTDDAGRTWEQIEDLSDLMVNGLDFRSDGRVIAATDAGVALSDDGGETWSLAGQDLGYVAGAVLCGSGTETVLLVGLPEYGAPKVPGLPHTAIGRSIDGGQTWTPSNDGLTARLAVGLVLAGSADSTASAQASPGAAVEDATVYVATLDTGLLESNDGGRSWHHGAEELGGLAVSQVVTWVGPGADRCVIVATEQGSFLRRGDGSPWQPALEVEAPGLLMAVAVADRAVTICQAPPDGRLLSSTNEGVSWEPTPTPRMAGQVVGLALSPAYSQDGAIYLVLRGSAGAASVDGVTLWRGTDGGQRWDRWLELPDAPGESPVQVVAPPPNRWDDTVVLGLGGQVYRPRQGSWEVSGGSRRPVWDAVQVGETDAAARLASLTGLAVSPAYASDRTLFAATSAGVFVSRDGGATFVPWSDGLEALATVALAVSPSYAQDRLVYALGLGGSVWRRRDP